MKKTLVVLVVLTVALSSVLAKGAPESSATETMVTLKFAEQLPEGHIMANTLTYFAEEVEKLSNGSMKTELYYGGVLGDDQAMLEAVKLGTIDVIRVEFTTLCNLGAKKVIATTLPYVFRDRDHYWKVADSLVGQELLTSIQEDGTGMVGLCMVEEGARHFFAKTPLNSIEDMKGKKIRVQDTAMYVAIVKALGASPTPMSFSELYTALNSGTVDGAEQPLSGYVSNMLYEVAPYMILDGHVYPAQSYVISEKKWNKLSDNQKQIIRQAAAEASKYNRANIEAREQEIMNSLAGLGVTVVVPSDSQAWVDAMQPVYSQFADGDTLTMLQKIQGIK